MKNIPKILFLIPSLNSGGIETYLLRFLQSKKSEMEVEILVRGSGTGDLYHEYKNLDVTLLFMPLGYINPIRWWKFYDYFKKSSFNTICDFNANFAGIPMWLAKMAGVKNRITFYRQGKNHFRPLLIKMLYNYLMNRMVYKYSTKILANSKAAHNFFFPYRKPADARFKVIYNGINFRELKKNVNKDEIKQKLGIPVDSFIIGHTGRLDQSKNHTTILDVASELIYNFNNIYLVLCGHGTEKLIDKVVALNIKDNVRLLGYRPDVNEIMQIFDVFYFPSVTEGQPNALLEAMAIGVPVVAGNIEPIKEILPDTSVLFNPYDKENVINHIQKIVENPNNYYRKDLIDYTITMFNADERFNDFMNELR